MKNKSKKRAVIIYLNALIIAVIVLILLLIIGGTLASFIDDVGKTAKCQATLLKSSFLDKTFTFGYRQGTIQCNNLPDTIIKSSDAVLKGKINDNAVKKKISDSMYDCWKMTGKGQIDPFKKYDDDTTYCMICSDIIFNEDFKKKAKEEDYKITNNVYWLATNLISDTKTTYFEAIYDTVPDITIINNLKDKETPIDISQQYAVVWRLETVKKSMTGELVSSGAGALAGAASGAFIGSFIPIPIVGTAGGAIIGLVAGTVSGFFGTHIITDKFQGTVSNEIFVVPKLELGQRNLIINGEETPFCTKLVNY